jgi:hypothetical protein
MECETQVEVKWSVSTAWADAGESAYVKGFAQGKGDKHNSLIINTLISI